MGPIRIILNGDEREVAEQLDLHSLLEHLSMPQKRVAIELNLQVIPRSEWDRIVVRDGDRIEVVHFVGGG